jgi:hypothetical protein
MPAVQRGRLKLVVGLARLMAPSLGLAQTNQNRGRQRSKHVFQTRSQFLPLQPSRVMSLSSRKMGADSYRNQLTKNKDCSQRYFIFLRFFKQLPAIAPPNTSKRPSAIDFDRGSEWSVACEIATWRARCIGGPASCDYEIGAIRDQPAVFFSRSSQAASRRSYSAATELRV